MVKMRTFARDDNGKVYAKLDLYGNRKRVHLASLFMNRLLKPGMGMAAIAEHHVARLLNGTSKEKQVELVNELAGRRAMSMEQADILRKSGMITDKGAHSALAAYTLGEVRVRTMAYNDGKP